MAGILNENNPLTQGREAKLFPVEEDEVNLQDMASCFGHSRSQTPGVVMI